MRRFMLVPLALLALPAAGCGKKVETRPVLAEMPGRSIPALSAGDRSYASGDLASAEKWYAKAIEAEPTSADAHYLRARARLDLGNLDGAEEDVGKALQLQPRHWEAVCLRGVLFERQGKREEAWIAFRDARNLAPGSLAPRNNLAFLALLESRNEEAYEMLVALSKEFPDSARVLNNLSLAAERLGRADEAKRARAAALRLDGVNP